MSQLGRLRHCSLNRYTQILFKSYGILSRLVTSDTSVQDSVYQDKDAEKKINYANFRITGQEMADLLVNNIKFFKEKETIIEVNPGMGLVTKKLLAHPNVGSIRALESTLVYHRHLGQLMNAEEKKLGKLRLFKIDPSSLTLISIFNPKKIEELFEGVQKSQWSDEPSFKVVGTFHPSKARTFLRRIVVQTIEKFGIFSYGRPEFYLFIGGSEWDIINSKSSNGYDSRGAGVIYNLFYDIELLSQIPYKNNVTRSPNKHINAKSLRKFDEDNAFLIRMVPKKDLFDRFDSYGLHELRYFVSQLAPKRRHYLIPTLEKWFPLCGIELIRRGYTTFGHIEKMKTEDFLDIFLYVRSLPSYNESNFCLAIDDFLQRRDERIEMLKGVHAADEDQLEENKEIIF